MGATYTQSVHECKQQVCKRLTERRGKICSRPYTGRPVVQTSARRPAIVTIFLSPSFKLGHDRLHPYPFKSMGPLTLYIPMELYVMLPPASTIRNCEVRIDGFCMIRVVNSDYFLELHSRKMFVTKCGVFFEARTEFLIVT
jgi:hypothetical protein